ncbi:lipid-A-disaccharide synthase [Alkalilacustris brevis]|uniref:lipid-A-disaccharide synthase n=1 Tax=Alkalilacustris brevis TaxID=2026338 RepID=UPI000E0DBA2C|nr:lipid-A-disaccharide synthase [Alkalilacustris brevis]
MKLFVIAGEPSGDALGAALMQGLAQLAPEPVEFLGIGGPQMQAEGLQSLFPMEELSVMGLAEVLPRYFDLRRRIDQAAQAVLSSRAEALITIDSPDFCLRVARKVRARNPGLRTIHYVAPSVWAWRAGRAAKMARVIDHVLAILPFEPPYMQAAGMSCDFVGHPVASQPVADAGAAQAFRARHAIAAQAPLLLALPGSRAGELARLGPVFGEVLQQMVAAQPDLRVVLPTVRGVADTARALATRWPGAPVVLDPAESDADEKRAAFAAADLALAASGTVSLELAASGTPMVIAYDMNPLTRFIVARMLRVDTVTLVNLVSETRAVPEFLGPRCRAELIVPALRALMQDGPERATQLDAMARTMERLGRGGPPPGLRAAASVLRVLGRKPAGVSH